MVSWDNCKEFFYVENKKVNFFITIANGVFMKTELKSRLKVPLTGSYLEPKYLIDNGTLKDAIGVMEKFNIGSIIVMMKKLN